MQIQIIQLITIPDSTNLNSKLAQNVKIDENKRRLIDSIIPDVERREKRLEHTISRP